MSGIRLFRIAFTIIILLLPGMFCPAAGRYNNQSTRPVFSQKGGMINPGDHSIYIRLNDEWTGFSSIIIGYRYGVNDSFNAGFEIGASAIPHVYLAGLILHFKMYETDDNRFFLGMRTRLGYKYQKSDFSSGGLKRIVGDDYLELERNGLYACADLTAAVRLGSARRWNIFYTIYPRLDIDFAGHKPRVFTLFSPGNIGFEFKFKKNPNWSFAYETGFVMPMPYNSLPKKYWVNFPSLGNIGFYYVFPDQ